MNEDSVFSAHFIAELPDGFQKGKTFDIADCAADFHDGNIETCGRLPDKILDFVGNVRNDLHGFTQVVAASFFGDDGIINLPGCQIVALPHAGGSKSFVMAQIQIGFRSVVGHENFAVLERDSWFRDQH